jgi:hypothetical protein
MEEARFGWQGVEAAPRQVEEGFSRSMPRRSVPQDGITEVPMHRFAQPPAAQAEPRWPRVFPSL